MTKFTLLGTKLPSIKKSGFRTRLKTLKGQNIIKRRRKKGRVIL
jgi:ribosomal protein L34